MKRILLILASLASLLILASPGVALAATSSTDAVCQGVALTTGTTGCSDAKGSPSVQSTITLVINVLSFVVGFAAVIMIIIGGFRFITAGGDSGKVASAKDSVLYSIVGLVVVVLAQTIVKFVLNKVG